MTTGLETPRQRAIVLLMLVVVAAGTGIGYFQDGSWQTRELIELSRKDPRAAQQQMLESMVAKLQAQVKRMAGAGRLRNMSSSWKPCRTTRGRAIYSPGGGAAPAAPSVAAGGPGQSDPACNMP